mmetsp:Transcript_4612/g.7150  ORF Transcript_4612/g.7150 Transcript_4612/m.7150 type:complete len:184 (+) Transcript_4612:72-623(+)
MVSFFKRTADSGNASPSNQRFGIKNVLSAVNIFNIKKDHPQEGTPAGSREFEPSFGARTVKSAPTNEAPAYVARSPQETFLQDKEHVVFVGGAARGSGEAHLLPEGQVRSDRKSSDTLRLPEEPRRKSLDVGPPRKPSDEKRRRSFDIFGLRRKSSDRTDVENPGSLYDIEKRVKKEVHEGRA